MAKFSDVAVPLVAVARTRYGLVKDKHIFIDGLLDWSCLPINFRTNEKEARSLGTPFMTNLAGKNRV